MNVTPADGAKSPVIVRWPMMFTLLLAICAAGCVIIPVPPYNTGDARRNVSKHTPEQFEPGKTTMEDVITKLGEPDVVSSDEGKLGYRSEKVVAFVIIYEVGGGPVIHNKYYVFDFDGQGRLQTIKPIGLFDYISPSLGSGDSNSVPVTVRGERVLHLYPKSDWFSDVVGYRSKDGKISLTSGAEGQLMLTESNLAFVTLSQFANTEPDLILPFAAVNEVRVDKYYFGRRLVIRTRLGQYHSFEIQKTNGWSLDKPATQAACDFIQSKIKPAPPETDTH